MKKTAFILLTVILIMLIHPVLGMASDIELTQDEMAFIEEHPVIHLGVDPDFIPFEFIDNDGNYKGIANDYLELIQDMTGLEFDIAKGLTWPEAYEKAVAGEIDVLPAVSETHEREKYFLFTDSYYVFTRVIVTQDTDESISGIEDLSNITVAVQRNSSHHSYLLSYPSINLSLYDSVTDALTAVANGTETAFVGNLATTNYLLKSNGLNNLKFTAFDSEQQQGLHFAVRQDWPELVSILNKALAAVTQEDKININNKWIDLDTNVDYGPIIRGILIAGSVIVMIFIVSFFWIIRLKKEIIKRKQTQEALERAKQEAEEANNFKSSFMARMSHEIRTPLNAISGMSYLLKSTDITLTQKMYIDRIMQASTNMLSIINDILDFSKIEAGKVELEVASFHLDQVIQDVVNIVSYKIEEQEIGFRLTKDPSIPGWFFGDAKRIEQILLNILNNAVKFTTEGEVSLDIRLVAKEDDQYHLSFTIKDTGIGMTKEQVSRLFEPFTQADVSITRRFGGTGLGLSIVKNLVEMMDGHVKVYSTEGEGSTFLIQLTLRIDSESEAEDKRNISAEHFRSVKTLVLEKSGANMNMIESYLRSFGMNCEITTSQSSAYSMLEVANKTYSEPFDLFIIDYETPDEGGFQFVDRIHANQKIVKQPKTIMLFPMMREDLFDQLKDHNIDIGIEKPIIPSILLNGILDIFNLKAVGASQIQKNEMHSIDVFDKNYSVLIVEDNKTNQLIAKALLEKIGLHVYQAMDGKSGIEIFKENQKNIDVILMDLHMPVMDGYDASLQIRRISKEVPIIAMTADVILGVKEKCEANGIDHYISKPFEPEQFIRTIRDIIYNKDNGMTEDHNVKKDSTALLDKEAGMRNLGGNEELYNAVLAEYAKENADFIQRYKELIGQKNYEEAALLVHKVKSSLGSIGAKAVYEKAVNLQKILESKDEEGIRQEQNEFIIQMEMLLQELQ